VFGAGRETLTKLEVLVVTEPGAPTQANAVVMAGWPATKLELGGTAAQDVLLRVLTINTTVAAATARTWCFMRFTSEHGA
jgi:hypothetical protein